MAFKVLQPSFSGGVFSPSLYSRVDLSKYSTGLRTAKNFFIHPHGGASNRQGTEYIAAAKNSAKKCRLIPFEFSLEQAYVLEAGENYIRVFKDGALSSVINNYTEYNPTASYAIGDFVHRNSGCFVVRGGANISALSFGVSGSIPNSVSIISNNVDTLVVSNEGTYTGIKLANATASKNSAALIQAAMRAAWSGTTGASEITVTENAEYAAARWTTGIGINSQPYAGGLTSKWRCEAAVTGNANNTSVFPVAGANWSSDTSIIVTTPYLEADLPELKFAQSADVLYVTHPKYQPRMLVRYGDDDWAFDVYPYANGPFMPSNLTAANTLAVSATTGTGKTLTAAADTFYAGHVGSLWQLRHNVAGQRVSKAFTGVAASTAIKCGRTWRIITGGTWTGQIDIEKSVDGGATWTIIRGFAGNNDLNINTFGDVDAPCLVRANAPAFTSGTCTANLTSDAYEHTGIVKITAIANTKSATCDILTEVGDTAAVWDWSEGSWSDYRGWPRAVTFHEDRLCFAGTDWEPQTTWTTQTGIYTDFGRSVPLVDSDGISVNLSARKMSGVKHLISLNGIAAMTSASEWSIGYDTNITPTNVPQRCVGYHGCSDVAPIMVGDRVLYFSPMGGTLLDMAFSFESNSFKSDDITIMASHLFDGSAVVDMAYQQEPDSLLWCVRDDGVLLSLTYMREQEVFAWTEHETDGDFEAVCSIPGDGYNEVWFVVKRTINGATVRCIERLVERMASTAVASQFFVDCGKTTTNAPASTAVAGLSHLEGKTVSVLADGNVVSGLTVTGGAITLPTAAAKVIVGLPYTCDLETLNVELNLNTGTTQGAKVKISEVIIRFLNTIGGALGSDSAAILDTITEIADTTALHSVDAKQVISGGFDVGGRVFYRQTQPLPVTILAIIPSVSVGG